MDGTGTSRITPASTAAVAVALLISHAALGDERHRLLASVDAAMSIDSTLSRDRDLVWVGLDGAGPAVGSGFGDLLPDGVGVDALSIVDGHTIVFSTDVSFRSGRVDADDEDLVLYDHGELSLILDGSAAGIPESADIDAVHVLDLDPMKIIYSVDAAVEIDGTVVTNDDIIVHAGSSHALAVTGASMLGDEARRANVDGLWYDPSRSEYALSLDVAISEDTGRTAASPDDVLLWTNGALVMLFDASALGITVPGLDFDAVHVESTMFADGFETGTTNRWSSSAP
jgi:hypothetical protein